MEGNTGRMGVRVKKMEVKGLTDVTISISLLIIMMAFFCALSNMTV